MVHGPQDGHLGVRPGLAVVDVVLQVAGMRSATPEVLAKSAVRLIIDIQMHASYNLAMTVMMAMVIIKNLLKK